MKYALKELEGGDYFVVAVNEDGHGQILAVLFSGPEVRQRAEKYGAWKNSQLESPVNSSRVANCAAFT